MHSETCPSGPSNPKLKPEVSEDVSLEQLAFAPMHEDYEEDEWNGWGDYWVRHPESKAIVNGVEPSSRPAQHEAMDTDGTKNRVGASLARVDPATADRLAICFTQPGPTTPEDPTAALDKTKALNDALAVLPTLEVGLRHALCLVDENARLKKLLEVAYEARDAAIQGQALGLLAGGGKGKGKEREMSEGQGRIDSEKINVLALQLIDGEDNVVVAGALLDEVERARGDAA